MSTMVLSLVTFIYFASFVVLLLSEISARSSLARSGKVLAAAGLLLHTAGIALRWVESHQAGMGHAPLSNFYESLVFFSWALVLLHLLSSRKGAEGLMGVFMMPAAFLLMAYASFSPAIDSQIRPLIPALKSNWLIVHVVTCFLGYAAFFMASSAGIVFLVKGGRGDMQGALEEMLDSSMKLGFVLFSFGIVTGSVWAHLAWGMYWGWDPKETWALITWLIYAAAMHERIRLGSVNRRVALMTVIGLASVVFTYFGVNYLPGLHSYL